MEYPTSTSIKQRVTAFFDHPHTAAAMAVRGSIVLLIVVSTAAIIIELISPAAAEQYRTTLTVLEWVVGGVFAVEYLLRLWAAETPRRFVFNFYNIIDLCAILPLFITGTNISAIRVVRLVRFMRLMRSTRLLRIGKLLRYFWETAVVTTSRVAQENIIKNIVLVVLLFGMSNAVENYFRSVDVDVLGDVLLASSVIGVGAMFAFFSLSYQKMNIHSMGQRFFMHLTTGLLLLPIGIMFLIIQTILEIKLGSSPLMIVSVVWLVYGAIMLWDMWNALSVQEIIDRSRG